MNHFPFVRRKFKLDLQLSRKYERQSYREAGSVPKPRVASTLVKQGEFLSTRNGLCQLDATALRLRLAIQFITQGCRSANPGL